jgi:cyclophilin family peptidyl-prolyl cis-trans isomerase
MIAKMADMNPLQYAIFGRITRGDDTLKKFEQLPTRREGIFVMVIFS